MICRESIDPSSETSPKTFTNWARALTFTAPRSFRPTRRGEIVDIIKQAEDDGRRVKWTGSVWSFMGVYQADDVVIESDAITGVIDRALILDSLALADESTRASLAHIRGGTKVFNVNRLLHGLPAAANGGGADEAGLVCGSGRALETLGGSGGQSIAGVMATGSHGGDVHLPPIADCVRAIHLIGPGGQEFWIERSSGLTAGSEAETQAALRGIVDADPAAAAEMCNGILVRKDDALFRAALVSVGRMGFVYSLVVNTVAAFKLQETRSAGVWEDFRTNVGSENFDTFTSTKRFLNVLINPFGSGGRHDCKIAERIEPESGCDAASAPPGPGGSDFFAWLCHQQDVSWIAAILIAAIAVLVLAIVGLVEAISIMAATATLLLGIPVVGWALAAALIAAIAVLVIIIAALGLTIAALLALLGFITFNGGTTPGQLVAAITNFAFTVGLQEVMRAILVNLFNSAYDLNPRTDLGWKIMDTYGYAAEDFCQKVDSLEIAFDVAAASATTTPVTGYLAFIDEVFAIFDELYGRHIAVAFILALRYTRNTEALIGMSKFERTCHIEIPVIRDFAGNAEFIERVQRAAIAHGGVPHWGQLMGTYTGSDILALHGADLTLWRRKLTQLIREGGGNRSTFSNTFTSTYNLEPFDETPITLVRFAITVGDDALGDTDVFRPHVSADFVNVFRLDGSSFGEISLNEGATWPGGSFHVRDVMPDRPTTLGEIRRVLITHHAEGDDINADNWTAALIVVTAVLADGTERELTRAEGVRFRKNDHQTWEQVFV